MTEDRKAVSAHITGRVQGVSFRYWAMEEAAALGIDGWVRNEADGSVRALLAGRERAVAAMVERLWQGPPAARVTGVAIEDADAGAVPAGFRIAR